MNGNVELGHKLGTIASNIPQMAPQVKDLNHFESIRSHLEEMKAIGEQLKLAELRMQTIKDKIDIFSNQVEGFTEQADMEEAEETPTVSLYTVVDEEDPIDVLVGAAMTERFANVTISR